MKVNHPRVGLNQLVAGADLFGGATGSLGYHYCQKQDKEWCVPNKAWGGQVFQVSVLATSV